LRLLPRNWLRLGVSAGVVTIAAATALATLFGSQAGPAWWLATRGPLGSAALRIHPVADSTPACFDWQADLIVATAMARRPPGAPLVVGVVPSLPTLNAATIRFWLAAAGVSAETRDLAGTGPSGLQGCHLIVRKQGEQGPEHATRGSATANAQVMQRGARYPILASAALPDGSRLILHGVGANEKD
jgi:hypothetical protein